MSQKRVLIVDDDEALSAMLLVLVKRLLPDYQVIAVKDGVAALTELQERVFDLILTDYDMPRMNGLDLARAARQISPGIPIVLMTGGYSYREIQTRADSTALDSFLAKPFTMLQLRETLQRSWDIK